MIMSLQKNIFEAILSSPRTVFNVQSLHIAWLRLLNEK